MADRPRLTLDAGAWAVALAVVAFGLAHAGAGFVNGDAAAYAAQAWSGEVTDRWVHVGYVLLARAFAPLAGDALPGVLDGLSAVAAAATVLGAAGVASRHGAAGWTAALFTAVAVVPVCMFAEVDLVWAALVVWSAALPAPFASGALLGLAVTVSPVALLAVPWVLRVRGAVRWAGWTPQDEEPPFTSPADRWVWAIPLIVVAVLTLLSLGDWWVGERGVLTSPLPRLGRSLSAFAGAIPWWGAPLVVWGWVLRGGPGLLLGGLLLLAPADTHAWVPVVVSCAVAAGHAGRSLWNADNGVRPALFVLVALLAVDGLLSVREARRARVRVAAEDALVRSVVAQMGPRDGLVATWSWGARASVIATGNPYSLAWRVPGEPVRDQVRWCNARYERVFLLPPDLGPEGTDAVVPGTSSWLRSMPGCEQL